MASALAQSGMGSMSLWLVALVAAVIVGAVVLFQVRRRLLGAGDEDAPGGLTLQDLRDLRARGELSDEEFERAKRIIVGEAALAERGRVNPLTGRPRDAGE